MLFMHYTGYLLFFCILSFAFIYLIIKIYIIFLHHCHFPECILLVVKGRFQSLNPVFHLLNSGKDYVYKPQMNAVHPFDENDYLPRLSLFGVLTTCVGYQFLSQYY